MFYIEKYWSGKYWYVRDVVYIQKTARSKNIIGAGLTLQEAITDLENERKKM